VLRRRNLFHWCALELVGLLVLFTVVPPPDAARAAVVLIDMNATAQVDGTILVKWETATELNTIAFRLYRAQTSSGPWNTWVNMQPAQGDGMTGAMYIFTDQNVEPGTTYYYLLEEIDTNGTATLLVEFIRHATVPFIIYLPLLARAN
jgi:hypothetical protein